MLPTSEILLSQPVITGPIGKPSIMLGLIEKKINIETVYRDDDDLYSASSFNLRHDRTIVIVTTVLKHQANTWICCTRRERRVQAE